MAKRVSDDKLLNVELLTAMPVPQFVADMIADDPDLQKKIESNELLGFTVRDLLSKTTDDEFGARVTSDMEYDYGGLKLMHQFSNLFDSETELIAKGNPSPDLFAGHNSKGESINYVLTSITDMNRWSDSLLDSFVSIEYDTDNPLSENGMVAYFRMNANLRKIPKETTDRMKESVFFDPNIIIPEGYSVYDNSIKASLLPVFQGMGKQQSENSKFLCQSEILDKTTSAGNKTAEQFRDTNIKLEGLKTTFSLINNFIMKECNFDEDAVRVKFYVGDFGVFTAAKDYARKVVETVQERSNAYYDGDFRSHIFENAEQRYYRDYVHEVMGLDIGGGYAQSYDAIKSVSDAAYKRSMDLIKSHEDTNGIYVPDVFHMPMYYNKDDASVIVLDVYDNIDFKGDSAGNSVLKLEFEPCYPVKVKDSVIAKRVNMEDAVENVIMQYASDLRPKYYFPVDESVGFPTFNKRPYIYMSEKEVPKKINSAKRMVDPDKVEKAGSVLESETETESGLSLY